MEDEIDLRKYFLLLIKNWGWIVGATVVFAGVVYLTSKFFLEPTYQAKALVVVIQPNYTLTLDPKFSTDTRADLNFYRPIAQLAETDDMMRAVQEAWNEQGGTSYTLQQFKGMFDVETSATINAITLVATSKEPEVAARLVNIWAQLFVQHANQVFSQGLEGEDALLGEVDGVTVRREAAEQAFKKFEEQSLLGVSEASLEVKQVLYARILADQAAAMQTIHDLKMLQSQITGLPANQAVSYDTELTALLLQLNAYNLVSGSTQTMQTEWISNQTQIQLNIQPPETTRTARELNAHLEQLGTVLSQQVDAYALQLGPLETDILALQGEIKTLETARDRLQQNYNVASETYVTLSRKLEETRIANQVATGTVKLASSASVPLSPSGPNTLLFTFMAASLGFVGSILLIFLQDFWKSLFEEEREGQTATKPAKA